MQRVLRLCAFILLTFPAILAGADPAPGLDNIPRVVADVGDIKINRDALIRELAGSAGPQALDRLVRRKVIEQAARDMRISLTDAEIDDQLNRDRLDMMAEMIYMPWNTRYKEFPIEKLIESRYRMSVQEYKQTLVREKLLVRKCLTKGIDLSQQEAQQFFNANPELFRETTRYRASHILISPLDPRDFHNGLRFRSAASQMDSAQRERRRINLRRDDGINLDDAPPIDELDPMWREKRQEADEILRKINTGVMTWEQAVRMYSQDPLDRPFKDKAGRLTTLRQRQENGIKITAPGEVGWFTSRGPVVKEFYEAAKNLKPGDPPIGPVRTEYGYHLIKMLEIKESAKVDFDMATVQRVYMDVYVRSHAEEWLKTLVDRAVLKSERALLWPPIAPAIQIQDAAVTPRAGDDWGQDGDPVIGSVNNDPIKRSEVWRELIRADGEEALNRLVNQEIVVGMLATMGLDRLEWESADPHNRKPNPPAVQPIRVTDDEIDLELNDDRLAKDASDPHSSFADYIYKKYGKSPELYKRAIKASIVLRKAVREKIPIDDATLHLQYTMAKDLYTEPTWYDASYIFIAPKGNKGNLEEASDFARMQALTDAERVRKAYLDNPANWSKLAAEFEGGTLGVLTENSQDASRPETALIYDELEKQKIETGQISAPVKTARGYYVIRVNVRHKERRLIFEEVKGRVERDYLHAMGKAYVDIWLRALNAQARIKRYLFASSEKTPADNFIPPKPPKEGDKR